MRRRRSKCMDKHFLCLGWGDVQQKRVNHMPWKYNSLLVTNTICQVVSSSRKWRHSQHCSHTAQKWNLSTYMKPSAMIVLLCHTVIEHNYLHMTRWKVLRDHQCSSVIIKHKYIHMNFSCVSLHILLLKETAGVYSVCINLTQREVNSEDYFRFTAASYVNIFFF